MNDHSFISGVTLKSTTRQKIIISASECFSLKGFSATSISDIAKVAGISQGAMYNHFKGKSDLIVAIVNEEMEQALATYAQPYDCSSLERIYQLVRTCVMKTSLPVCPRLWTEIMAESARNAQVKTCFIDSDKAIRGALQKIIEDGIARKEFSNINPQECSIVLFALIDGLISRRAINPEFHLDKHLSSFQNTITNLLKSSPE